MLIPQKWSLKRPGNLLPVFFLSLSQLAGFGQFFVQEAAVAALGGAYVTRPGFSCASHNQAGLGWIEDHSVTLQHSRPFVIKELGISTIAAQAKVKNGALGTAFSSFGIAGLRQTSVWLAYGMKLSPVISAGAGIHFWTWSLPERRFHQPGITLGLGIQVRIRKQWMIGAHVRQPASWSIGSPEKHPHPMILSTGCSFSFFETATCYADLHFMPENRIQLAQGIEWTLYKSIVLMLGVTSQPYTWSMGISILHYQWDLHLAIQYVADTGCIPLTSIHHVW